MASQLVATATSAAAIVASPNPLLIGRRIPNVLGQSFPVNGRTDEAAIWSGALSDAQVAALWNGGSGIPANQILASVPEPSSVAMGMIGVVVIAGAAMRGRHRRGHRSPR